jgi:hypothetical protein
MRADAYYIDGRASYKLASGEDSDALPWVFVVQPHPLFPQTHTTSIFFFTQDRGRIGWQLFHVRPVRRFVMAMHLGLKWTISYVEKFTCWIFVYFIIIIILFIDGVPVRQLWLINNNILNEDKELNLFNNRIFTDQSKCGRDYVKTLISFC